MRSRLGAAVAAVGGLVAGVALAQSEFFNDVKVPMRDGVNLAADVYLPSNRTGRIGCWLSFSPYGATKPDRPQGVGRAEEWGVAAVFADCRGLCHSEGKFETWESRMVDDADDLLNWISAQPWSNGRVVMTGGSYPGHTQLAAMRSGNPALVACAPGVITFEPDTINFQNGVLVSHFMRGWHSGLAGKASWEELTRHPTCDAWWRERTDRRKLALSRGRAFYQAGWYDLLGIRTFASFKEMPKGSVLRVGPWNHGVNTFDNDEVNYEKQGGLVTEDAEIEFLRSALEGRESESARWPGRILLYVMGRNEWRYENEWPLARTLWRDYDFTGGETKAFEHDPKKPVPAHGGRMLGGCGGQRDQRKVEALPGVVSYTGETLAEDLEVTGDVSARLLVSSTAACSDVTVKLVDVRPDGRALNVVDGICRATFAPGEKKEVSFFVDITSYVFLKGHRIRVDVAGAGAGHFEVNPAAATITIHPSSKLVLPTVPPRKRKDPSDGKSPPAFRADEAAHHLDYDWWRERFAKNLRQIKESKGEIDLVFLGDSITHYWDVGEGSDTSTEIEDLRRTYTILSAGYGGDWCQNVLWRVQQGELDGYRAKLVMLTIGTNNAKDTPEQKVARIREIVKVIRAKQPDAKVLLLPIFPRGAGLGEDIRKVSDLLFSADFDDHVIRFSFNDKMVDENGMLRKELFEDGLHPSAAGYALWRREVEPIFRKVVGK